MDELICPACESLTPPTLLGSLGSTEWYRCRACGVVFTPPDPAAPIPDDPPGFVRTSPPGSPFGFVDYTRDEGERLTRLTYCPETGRWWASMRLEGEGVLNYVSPLFGTPQEAVAWADGVTAEPVA